MMRIRQTFRSPVMIGLLLAGVLGSSLNARADSGFAGSWFAASALTPAYQALAAGDSALAWQYLLSAVRAQSVPVSAWQPLYQAILEESECGRLLPSVTDSPASLSLQQRSSGEHQAFQVRWSSAADQAMRLEGASTTVRLMLDAAAVSAANHAKQEAENIELESTELSAPLPSGVYQITRSVLSSTLSEQQIVAAPSAGPSTGTASILLTPWPQQRWVQLDGQGNRLQLTPPVTARSCPAVSLQWQWFDAEYRLLGAPWPIRLNAQGAAQLPETIPAKAVWLSAVVTQTRYQGQLRIAEQQRLTLPLRWVRSAQGE
ncbi:hypothetical protein C7R88_06050 [Plesiomonas shigelloides]|uniref:DUF2861 family protein n=1 Tax=Plesiomonas shigelloides TaxID=703 RepID=UPI000D11CAE4|nr:DUF2861 family protein [Plesiomonas shigelloides]AVQ86913.1 hypothetical protein C7R88_06050 [Plesiomonas shigelloides]